MKLKIFFALLFVTFLGFSQSKEIESVTYVAKTTGGASASIKVHMTPSKTTFEKNGVSQTFDTDQILWKKINRDVRKINLSDISNLKSPTNRRAYGGALTATLTVDEGEFEYTSSKFDDGTPPSLIKQIVDDLMYIIRKHI
ncbi:hypothetical protein [Aureivirga sp. CE67]|uniref:hypothetical protein n=1 Tax=Aureivirga sp. CE67 TaxID=1788983 RepID=UPI0018CB9AEE|nr:hypothetical protein [Aureivirga sp. CE67]